MDMQIDSDDFVFLPLGGSGEIGMNANLYHYKGRWLMVDLGISFPDESMPGVDVVLPDLCLLYTSPSPRDLSTSRMPSSA